MSDKDVHCEKIHSKEQCNDKRPCIWDTKKKKCKNKHHLFWWLLGLEVLIIGGIIISKKTPQPECPGQSITLTVTVFPKGGYISIIDKSTGEFLYDNVFMAETSTFNLPHQGDYDIIAQTVSAKYKVWGGTVTVGCGETKKTIIFVLV